MLLFDTHVHLDDEAFDPDRDDVVDRARQQGVCTLLCVGISAASSETAVRLAERYGGVYAAVGIQPNYAIEAGRDDWERIVALADHPRVVALGETGLDRHWDFTPFALQEDYFDRHLRLAQFRGLPLVVHCRDCESDVLRMLGDAAMRGPLRGVMHAFSGTQETAEACLEMGFFLSFAGMVTYTNKGLRPLRAIAAAVPADRLLIETDSPYLVPHPLRGKEKRNEPARLALTAASLSELRGVAPEQLATETTANAERLFAIR